MSLNPSRFVISAQCQGGLREATRNLAASAMCLADDWAEDGCACVRVTDARGVVRDREQFRMTMLLVRQRNARLQRV